ncbi:MAG: hypothetical protein KC416_07020, partial [Myxococcales bacterium]|nr:hypothetical protein [Myxococcales bacterium]
MKRIAFGFGIGVVLAGCSAGSGGEGKGLEAGAAQVGEGVLSTVDGRPISVQRVQELVAATGLGPKEAVRRLQAEELLASEAKRRGFGDLPEVRMVGRRAAAQKLLEVVVEEPNGPKTFSDDRIRDEYETMKPTRFVLPERRTSVHFLAKIPEDASPELEGKAKALAEAEVAALRKATDL